MSRLNEQTLESFRSELRKIAFSPKMNSSLGAAGALGGAGAVAGALLGAGVKGVKNYREAKEQGATTGEALGSGLAGAGRGAARGAVIGGLAGAGGGAALGHINPAMADKMRAAVHRVPGAQFGQRQVHTVTGWTPEKGLGSIGHGAAPRLKAVEEAEKGLEAATSGKTDRSLIDRVMGRSATEGAAVRLRHANEAYSAGRKAEEMGLTSIPGYAKSLKNNGIRETVGTALNDQWKGMSPGMKALTVGLPAHELYRQVRSPNEVDEGGHTKGERIGGSLAATAGGLLLSPLTVTGQMLVGSGLTRAGGRAGRLIGPKTKAPAGAPDLVADSGQAVAAERNVTERAEGTPGLEHA